MHACVYVCTYACQLLHPTAPIIALFLNILCIPACTVQGFLVVYSVTDRASFAEVETLMDEIDKVCCSCGTVSASGGLLLCALHQLYSWKVASSYA